MIFSYPLGLLGLIGIPILIIIYIIKSHYVEQTVASVYLWNLSEKFLKKKKRLRFGGLLSLILEILAVAAISLTIARPQFIMKNSAYDYCFVLDASGSMMAESEDGTRFEIGKERIREIVSKSKSGSTYTLIIAGDTAYEVCSEERDSELVLAALDALKCDWGSVDYTDALELAQAYCDQEHSPLTYLVTDISYETEGIELINVAESEENYALLSYAWSQQKSKRTVTVTGEAISYDRDAELTLELYVDGVLFNTVTVAAEKAVATEFSVTAEGVDSFSMLNVKIANTDSLLADNEGIMYDLGKQENNRVLLISDAPTYLEFALMYSGKVNVTVVSTNDYSEERELYSSGYGLYIFDTFSDTSRLPTSLPTDGTIWFLNPQKSISGTGFSYKETVTAEGYLPGSSTGDKPLENRFEPTYTTSTSSLVQTLLNGMIKQMLSVKSYVKCELTRTFTTLLSYEGDSLIFVGNNENGNRQVVFAFDLQDTDLALKPDFLILLSNLLDYSFPTVLEQTLYTVGDEATINLPSGCTDLLLTLPDGRVTYPEFSSVNAYCSLEQVGTYKLVVCIGAVEQEYLLFVRLPEKESEVSSEALLIIDRQSDISEIDGIYDRLFIYFLILAIVFIADWGVYCYEQYQLR